MTTEVLLKKLTPPDHPVDVVLDTDAYNEIDDQFAIAYLMKTPEKFRVKALYAAPFHNEKSTGPADGMEKSYQELLHLLTLMDREEAHAMVYRGSDRYLPDETTPVSSDAANHLVKLAMTYTPEEPLYVAAIGAITNVASAILLCPEIIDRIVVVWLGGHAKDWPDTREFNMLQDVAAARVVFGCGVPLVQLPCMGVVSAFTVSVDDLKARLTGKNQLCDYLVSHTLKEMAGWGWVDQPWTRVIWDVTAIAWLQNAGLVADRLEPSFIPQYDDHYSFDCRRHFFRYVYHIDRDALWRDLIEKLTR